MHWLKCWYRLCLFIHLPTAGWGGSMMECSIERVACSIFQIRSDALSVLL